MKAAGQQQLSLPKPSCSSGNPSPFSAMPHISSQAKGASKNEINLVKRVFFLFLTLSSPRNRVHQSCSVPAALHQRPGGTMSACLRATMDKAGTLALGPETPERT